MPPPVTCYRHTLRHYRTPRSTYATSLPNTAYHIRYVTTGHRVAHTLRHYRTLRSTIRYVTNGHRIAHTLRH
eukprot:2064899-Rhodomonas_salina.2